MSGVKFRSNFLIAPPYECHAPAQLVRKLVLVHTRVTVGRDTFSSINTKCEDRLKEFTIAMSTAVFQCRRDYCNQIYWTLRTLFTPLCHRVIGAFRGTNEVQDRGFLWGPSVRVSATRTFFSHPGPFTSAGVDTSSELGNL